MFFQELAADRSRITQLSGAKAKPFDHTYGPVTVSQKHAGSSPPESPGYPSLKRRTVGFRYMGTRLVTSSAFSGRSAANIPTEGPIDLLLPNP